MSQDVIGVHVTVNGEYDLIKINMKYCKGQFAGYFTIPRVLLKCPDCKRIPKDVSTQIVTLNQKYILYSRDDIICTADCKLETHVETDGFHWNEDFNEIKDYNVQDFKVIYGDIYLVKCGGDDCTDEDINNIKKCVDERKNQFKEIKNNKKSCFDKFVSFLFL